MSKAKGEGTNKDTLLAVNTQRVGWMQEALRITKRPYTIN